MDKVSVVECGSYELEEVYAAVKKALYQIDFVIPENKMVLLKPNLMSQNRAEQHSVTHYALVDALCRMLKEKNCRIVIGDSSAFYQKGLTKEAFKTSKIKDVADKYGATLIAFEEEPLVLVPIDIGRTVKTVPSCEIPAMQNLKAAPSNLQELYLPQILFAVDLVINVCKLKTHGSMRLSGAIKNMFGCVPGGYKQRIHMWVDNKLELSDVILNIHESVKPALSVMDAVYSLDGGPSAIGKPVKTSKILASTNAAAVDIAACQMIGYEPEDIQLLQCAKKRHMIMDYDDVGMSRKGNQDKSNTSK